VPQDLVWYCLRKKGVPEHVRIIRDMYKNCTTSVTTSEGATKERHQRGVAPGICVESFPAHSHIGNNLRKNRQRNPVGNALRRTTELFAIEREYR